MGQLIEIQRTMSATRKISTDLNGLSERLESVIAELQDLAKECDRVSEATEHDPQRIQDIQDRLNTIYKLQKKRLLAPRSLVAAPETIWNNNSAVLPTSAKPSPNWSMRWPNRNNTCAPSLLTLHERRVAVVADFEEKVQSMLAQESSMPHSRLKVAVEPTESLGPTGADDVQFLFASNVGSPLFTYKRRRFGRRIVAPHPLHQKPRGRRHPASHPYFR